MSMPAAPAIAIACGGTGGHFYPGLAIARALREAGARPILFIAGHHQAKQIEIVKENGFAAIAAEALRLPSSAGAAFRFAGAFPAAIAAHRRELKANGVVAALGMGSFASAPLCVAARLRGIPLFLHEGNTTAGRANRSFARFANTFMLSFPLTNPPAARVKTAVVGMPVRQELVTAAAEPVPAELRAELRRSLGLHPERPTVLIFGGSQGAKAMNRTVVEAIRQCPPTLTDAWQLMVLTGTEELIPEITEACRAAGVTASVEIGTPDMANRYQAADAVICRAGASSIAELCLFRLAPLLVPFPAAADNHQQTNADWTVATGGAVCCRESQFTPPFLNDWLKEFTADPGSWQERGRKLAAHARPNAAADAAALIMASLAH